MVGEELLGSAVVRVRATLKEAEMVGVKGIKWYGVSPSAVTK